MRLWRDVGGALVKALRLQRDDDYDHSLLPWAREHLPWTGQRGRLMMTYRQELIGNGGYPRRWDR